MQNKTKIMFFDIDGTLVPAGRHAITPDAQAAIQKARAAGHKMFINTGRTMANLTDEILHAGFDGFVCACGTYILLDGQRVFYKEIPEEVCAFVREKANEYHLDIVFESWHGIYYDPAAIFHPDALRLVDLLNGVYDIKNYIPAEHFVFDKFVTWNRPDSDLPAFIQAIAPYFDYTDRENEFSEYVPHGYSKATGIQFVLDTYGMTLDQAYAIGDSNNDLPMLRYVPHSIAMGNSSPTSLFDIVEYVTASIDEGGIVQALQHYGFID